MPKPLPRKQGRSAPSYRFSIVGSRLLLVAVISAYTYFAPHLEAKGTLAAWIIGYVVFLIVAVVWGAIKPATLSLKRVRLIPAVVDVIFITVLVRASSYPTSPWFVFYIFPILSASRYLGYGGAFSVAGLSVVLYLASYLTAAAGARDVDPYTFALRCMVLVGVASVAGSLARVKVKEQTTFIRVLGEIDNEILRNAKIERILDLILRKCLEFTNSEMGHIRLWDEGTKKYRMAAVVGHPPGHDWGTLPFDERFTREAAETRKTVLVPQITKWHLKKYLGTYFSLHKPRPRSALFVPMVLKKKVTGVIAVYSPRSFHYTGFDASKLTAFTTLIELASSAEAARISAETARVSAEAAEERSKRLQLLYEISQELKSGSSLPALFARVVELTINRLGSEEASLFVRNDEDESRIDKAEVRGPHPAVSDRLRWVENSYSSGDSFTGKVFRDNEPYLDNDVDMEEKHAKEYAQSLPSGEVRHYLGVPLAVDDEVLGVIRVLNKKAAGYAQGGRFPLSDEGFTQEDWKLMTTIAGLVAPELRSAARWKRLAEAERRWKKLLLAAPDPIISLDRRGHIVFFNRACQKLWGVSYEEAKDQSVKGFYETPELAREIGRLLAEKPNHPLENFVASIKTKRGEIVPISLSAALLVDDDGGDWEGSIGVFKDLREYNRMQEGLVEAAKLSVVAALARMGGHDIKHSIGTALLYVDGLLVKCDREKDPRLFDIYTKIKASLQTAVDELQDLLTAYSSQPRHMKRWEVADVLRGVERQLRAQAAKQNIRLSVSCPPEGHTVSADMSQVARVFSNLFTNSRDAIEDRRRADPSFGEGRVRLSVLLDGAEVHLVWEDNGSGIAEQDRQRIFNAFFTKKQDGIASGLGLYIVKTILESHGGRITADPVEGEGARFRVTLPLSDGDLTNA